ncbi:hypothetical protein HDU80_000661 [Chytriomyces hyalinus]|nr:hypothetical protein HDU80_000661 [Chytriomyces hyalinus]
MGGAFNVAAESTDIHSKGLPLVSLGFQEAERVLMRVLLRYLHNIWRKEHPDSATDFTTWFYPDCRRNKGMHYDMILGTEQIAVSTHHAYDFTASDHVPVIAVVRLCNLRADFSHLLYGDDLQFDDASRIWFQSWGFMNVQDVAWMTYHPDQTNVQDAQRRFQMVQIILDQRAKALNLRVWDPCHRS